MQSQYSVDAVEVELRKSESTSSYRPLPTLDWRQTPEESLSDWRLVVVLEEIKLLEDTSVDGEVEISGSSHTTYDVHRCILAFGDRSCKYFTRTFKSTSFLEAHGTHMSTVKVPCPLIADAFPALLDYVYGITGYKYGISSVKGLITTENASPLFYLAEKLDNPALLRDVKAFIDKDISANEVTYYNHAKILPKNAYIWNSLLQASAVKMRNSLTDFEPNDQIRDAGFWVDVFHRCAKITRGFNSFPDDGYKGFADEDAVCNWIVTICEHNADTMDAEQFHKLTSLDRLPYPYSVSGRYAIEILKLEDKIVGTDTAHLSDLQSRCLEALKEMELEDWESKMSIQENIEFLSRFPLLLTQLLPRFVNLGIEEKKKCKNFIDKVKQRGKKVTHSDCTI